MPPSRRLNASSTAKGKSWSLKQKKGGKGAPWSNQCDLRNKLPSTYYGSIIHVKKVSHGRIIDRRDIFLFVLVVQDQPPRRAPEGDGAGLTGDSRRCPTAKPAVCEDSRKAVLDEHPAPWQALDEMALLLLNK